MADLRRKDLYKATAALGLSLIIWQFGASGFGVAEMSGLRSTPRPSFAGIV